MPAQARLSDAQVKKIRRRIHAGARQTDLAAEYGVNRKTIRRRLDALERTAAERTRSAEQRRLQRLERRAQATARREQAGRVALPKPQHALRTRRWRARVRGDHARAQGRWPHASARV